MKSRVTIHFLFGILLLMVMLSSCEEVSPDPDSVPDKNNEVSENRPILKDGSENHVETRTEDLGSSNYSSLFDALGFHNPSALALVNAKSSSEKKSIMEKQMGDFYLFEISEGIMQKINGKEGNEVSFSNIDGIHRINSEWQIITCNPGFENGMITMHSSNTRVSLSYHLSTDSIFDADTVHVPDATSEWDHEIAGAFCETIIDTVLVRADTILFNDTLWIQNSYAFTDTLDVLYDTIYSPETKDFRSLLLNVKNGELYDIGKNIWNTQMEGYYLFSNSIFDYNPENEKVYFEISENELGCLDLGSLTLEVINLPYPLQQNGHRTWAIMPDGNIFAWTSGGYIYYIPGEGIRKKSNSDYSAQKPFSGLHWRTKDNKRYMWMISDKMYLYEVQMRNDSIIYNEIDYTYESTDGSGNYFPMELNGMLRTIQNGEETWYHDGSYLYSFNEDSRFLRVAPVGNSILSSGVGRIYRLKDNSIDLIDLETLQFIPVLDYSGLEMDIKNISVNGEGNIVISGYRYFDLTDVVIEYDGSTGEKLNEWEERNAPDESNVIQLTPVF